MVSWFWRINLNDHRPRSLNDCIHIPSAGRVMSAETKPPLNQRRIPGEGVTQHVCPGENAKLKELHLLKVII